MQLLITLNVLLKLVIIHFGEECTQENQLFNENGNIFQYSSFSKKILFPVFAILLTKSAPIRIPLHST